MKTRLTTSLFALTAVLGTPALADVTAADVWANQQAYFEAMGVSLNGTLSDGAILSPEININLPMGVGSMQIKTDDVAMIDNGDGSVSVEYPSPMAITIAGAFDGTTFTGDMTMSHEGYTITATGDAGDVSFETDAQNLRMDFGDFASSDPNAIDVEITGFVNLASYVGTAQVTEGNVITRSSSFELGETTADLAFMIDGLTSTSKQTTQPTQTTGTISLPAGGSDVMNLAAALRNGLSIEFEAQGGASQQEAETLMSGEIMNRQVTNTGAQVATFSFDESGMSLVSEADGFDMVMSDQMLFPGDIEIAMSVLSMALDVPLSASEETQDFRIATSFQGLTMGDTIWNLFDPAATLPRDPAEISFDITGFGTNGVDWLNFIAVSEMMGPPPVEIDEVTIENLRITAAGADASAVGSMTFDWTDFMTIPGVPRPEGKVTVNLNGANALMDNLAAMGLIPEDELMMPRMMLGMFATPVGDDQLESVLEVNSEGHVLANGQRLQ